MARPLKVSPHEGVFPYIRWRYNVPAKRGGRVTYRGQAGTITAAGPHLHIRLDEREYKSSRVIVHPADVELVYVG
jgi:hypothetical protein